MKRRTLRLSAAILLALVCLAGTLPARAADGGELADGAIRWQLADGTLTVSGRGAIPDFDDKSQKTMDRVPTPWYSLRDGIERIVLEEGITAVGDHAFADLTQVRDVSLPQSLRSIGTDAFRGCAVTEVTLPAGLTELGGFRGCGKLTSINVPETVESVGIRAFEDCGSLRALSLPDGVRSVGFYAFGGTCGIETLYLPDSVVACSGGEAFFGNPSVRAIRFPAGTIRVDHNAGNLCSQCTALTDIWLPVMLCGLRGADFSGCTALTDIWFGGTEEQWADAGGTAFTDELADLGLTPTVHYGAADMERPAEGYVHTLAVFGVRYDGNMPQFSVYDCNFGASEEASLALFSLFEENGSLRWSYKGREGEADGGDTWLSWVSVTPDYLQNAACGAEASDAMMKAPGAVIPLPEGAAAWRSSDPAVAEIDPDGQAIALACGTATLTTLDENGAALFSRRVSVNDGDDLAVLTSEESVISGDVLSSGALDLENRTAGDLPVVILSACYGHDGRLLSVSQSRKTLRWGRSYAFPTLEALPDAAAVKYMILSGDGTMVPLIGSVDKPGPRQ